MLNLCNVQHPLLLVTTELIKNTFHFVCQKSTRCHDLDNSLLKSWMGDDTATYIFYQHDGKLEALYLFQETDDHDVCIEKAYRPVL